MTQNAYIHLATPPKPGAPLVFSFHGTGGDEHQFAGLVQQILPDAGHVSPRGDVSERGANRFFRRTAEGVYDMADLATRTRSLTGFIAAHVAAHKAANPAMPVYGLGYSNGANILASVMMATPDLFDRAALMHPLIPWSPDPVPGLAGKRVLITAGERDPICPAPQTRALIDWFTEQGAVTTDTWHTGGHDLRPEEVQALAQFLQAA